MSITALYVYSSTTFHSDSVIEQMFGAAHPAGEEVQLLPGIYRLRANANVVAKNDPTASKHVIVPLTGGKGGWPDPPLQAIRQHNTSAAEIKNFLGGEGEENELS